MMKVTARKIVLVDDVDFGVSDKGGMKTGKTEVISMVTMMTMMKIIAVSAVRKRVMVKLMIVG